MAPPPPSDTEKRLTASAALVTAALSGLLSGGACSSRDGSTAVATVTATDAGMMGALPSEGGTIVVDAAVLVVGDAGSMQEAQAAPDASSMAVARECAGGPLPNPPVTMTTSVPGLTLE